MYKVVNNRIYITRGDSAFVNFDLLDIRGQEVDADGELIFTLKRDGQVVMRRSIADSIKFSPADTQCLEYGEYVWDIQLNYNNGYDVETVLFGELVIMKEVGR